MFPGQGVTPFALEWQYDPDVPPSGNEWGGPDPGNGTATRELAMSASRWPVSRARSALVRLAVALLIALTLLLGNVSNPVAHTVASTEFAVGETVVVATDYLNLRASPSLDATILEVFVQGNAMNVTGGPVAAGGYTWYEIETWAAGPVAGWLAGEFLLPMTTPPDDDDGSGFPPQTSVRVDTDLLNVRTGPGLGYAVIRQVTQGTVFMIDAGPVLADGYHWYTILIPDRPTSGWVAGEFVSEVDSDGGETHLFEAGETVVIDTPWLNGRAGPGLEFPVHRILQAGAQATVLDGPAYADGYQWYHLDLGNFVNVWAIGKGLAPSSGGSVPGFGVGETATVATDALNLRDGIGLGAPVLRVLAEGTMVTVTGSPVRADGFVWYPVQTGSGGSGWVAGEYLV